MAGGGRDHVAGRSVLFWLVAGAILMLAAAPLLAALSSPASIGTGTTFNASDGPTVIMGAGTNANLSVVFPSNDTVAVGAASVTGPQGANATLFNPGPNQDSRVTGGVSPIDRGIQLARTDAGFTIGANDSVDELTLVSGASQTASGVDAIANMTASGNITLGGFVAGGQVTVRDGGGTLLTQKSATGGNISVSLSAGSTQLKVVGEAGTLSGVVRDTTGARIAGATVNATLGGTSVDTTTNSTGYYALNLGAAGTYDVDVDAGGYGTASAQVTVAGDTTRDFTVTVGGPPPPTGPDEVALQVLDAPSGDPEFQSNPPGSPVPGAGVTVEDGGVAVDTATTSNNGWAVLDINGTTKAYEIEIQVGGALRRTAIKTLDAGGTNQTGVVLPDPVVFDATADPANEQVPEQPGDSVTLSIDVDSDAIPSTGLTVEFYNFSSGNPASDTLLGSTTVSSGGTASASITMQQSPQSWYAVVKDEFTYTTDAASSAVSFRTQFGTPTVSNLSPDGTTAPVGATRTLSADVGHPSISQTTLQATFFAAQGGTKAPGTDPIIGSQTVSTSTTVSTSWALPPPGQSPHEWYVAVEDDTGQVVTSKIATIRHGANFTVDIITAPGAVTGGQSMTVEYLIQNVGGEPGTDSVTLEWRGQPVETVTHTLDPIAQNQNEFEIETVSVPTASVSSPTDFDLRVTSSTDSDTETVTVAPPSAALIIDEFSPPGAARAGETRGYNVTVANIGGGQLSGVAVQLLADETGGGTFTAQNSTTVSLAPGANTTVSLDYTAPAQAGETVVLKAQTAADAKTATITTVAGGLNVTVRNPFPADGATVDASTLLTNPLNFTVDTPTNVSTVSIRVERGGSSVPTVPPAVAANSTADVASTTTLRGAGFSLGTNSWRVIAEDQLGRTNVTTFSFSSNATLGIKRETAPALDVPAAVDVTVRELATNRPVIYDRTVSNAQFNLTTIPDAGVVIDLEASGYYTRAVLFDGIPAQQNLYLLNQSNDATAVTAVLEGGTVDPAAAGIQLERAQLTGGSQRTYRIVAGDQFGPGAPLFRVQDGTRYRVTFVNLDTGATQNMGSFQPEGDNWTVTVDPGVPPIEQGELAGGWQFRADLNETTVSLGGGQTATRQTVAVRFDDVEGDTTLLQYRIYERGNPNNELASDLIVTPTTHIDQYRVPKADLNSEWVVSYTVYRDGERIDGQETVTLTGDTIPKPLGSATVTILGIGMLLLVAGLFSVLSVGVGAVVTSLVGGLLWWLGWLGAATSGVAVVIALAVSVIYYAARRGP